MFQGHFNLDTAMRVEAGASPDLLFDLGMLFASGRSAPVDLVAAHKWFNLAALKGRVAAHPRRGGGAPAGGGPPPPPGPPPRRARVGPDRVGPGRRRG
ncbi:hypothetical protein, partial [Rhodopseudomonas sp. BAL398]|uniref:hypothetical protein n=1 Tax=Rhodopseudomonas sp. BAL398 TaxID=3034676 RepID=UPI0023E1EE31